VIKQSQLFRHALTAFEQALQTGNTEAVENLIRGPAEGRAAWQMGSLRVPAGAGGGAVVGGSPGSPAGSSGGAAGPAAGGSQGGGTSGALR
jgi:hypothetical protein